CLWLTYRHAWDLESYDLAFWGYTAFALMYALFLMIAVNEPRGVLRFVARLPFLRYLGILAYGIYLIHIPVNVLLHLWILGGDQNIKTPASLLVTFISLGVTILIAQLSWTYFEKPLVAMGHRFKYRSDVEAQPIPEALRTSIP